VLSRETNSLGEWEKNDTERASEERRRSETTTPRI
jgi:hypothetical protein